MAKLSIAIGHAVQVYNYLGQWRQLYICIAWPVAIQLPLPLGVLDTLDGRVMYIIKMYYLATTLSNAFFDDLQDTENVRFI